MKVGVPDWRLELFPELYKNLIRDTKYLIKQNLNDSQIQVLKSLTPTVDNLCHELSQYGLAESLNHCDFHENNILFSFSTQKVSIIDLGETAISHPFFSLAAFLRALSQRYKIALPYAEYRLLQDACFKKSLPGRDLEKALGIIDTLLPLYLIFTHIRLENVTPEGELIKISRMTNRIKNLFLEFIAKYL